MPELDLPIPADIVNWIVPQLIQGGPRPPLGVGSLAYARRSEPIAGLSATAGQSTPAMVATKRPVLVMAAAYRSSIKIVDVPSGSHRNLVFFDVTAGALK